MDSKTKSTVVILGGGFGGLRAAIRLAKKIRHHHMEGYFRVLLIDRNGYHTYTPTLYEAATTSKEAANYFVLQKIVTVPIEEITGKYGVQFLKAEIAGLDIGTRAVRLADGQEVAYDSLLLALGAETNYFDIPGLKEHSVPLKTFIDSIRIRDKIFEMIQTKKDIRIVIGGGGSTGVELAGEIQNWFGDRITTTIVEAGPSLMLGFPEKVTGKIRKRLSDLGAEVLANEAIAHVAPGKAMLKSGKAIPFDLMIWTGGVKASHLMSSPMFKTDPKGRVEVASDLKAADHVYGIGDAVCFINPRTGKPVPGVARVAIMQADTAADNIWSDLIRRPDHHAFEPVDLPYIIPVGGKWAVAKFGPFIFAGLSGWILKGLVEANYLISVLPFWKAIKNWLRGLSIFVKNDRLG